MRIYRNPTRNAKPMLLRQKRMTQKARNSPKPLRRSAEQVSDAIIKIADAKDLARSKRDMAVSIFRSSFNKAQPDDALSKDKAMRFRWDMEKLPIKEVKEIKAYWQKMKKVCAETPRPSWIDDSVRSFRCQLSSIKITGSRDYKLIGKEITIVPKSRSPTMRWWRLSKPPRRQQRKKQWTSTSITPAAPTVRRNNMSLATASKRTSTAKPKSPRFARRPKLHGGRTKPKVSR